MWKSEYHLVNFSQKHVVEIGHVWKYYAYVCISNYLDFYTLKVVLLIYIFVFSELNIINLCPFMHLSALM